MVPICSHKWGYPQSSSISMGFSLVNHPALGVPPLNPQPCAAHPEAGLLSASDVEQEMRQCGVGALMEVKSGVATRGMAENGG